MYWLSFGMFGGPEVAEASIVFTDGVDVFRLDVRSGHLFLDQALTPTGFNGVLGIDWGPIFMKNL